MLVQYLNLGVLITYYIPIKKYKFQFNWEFHVNSMLYNEIICYPYASPALIKPLTILSKLMFLPTAFAFQTVWFLKSKLKKSVIIVNFTLYVLSV